MGNVPKLRFPGFSGEWEKIELGRMGTFMKGSAIGKKDLAKNGEPCILYGELYTKYGETVKEVLSKTNNATNSMLRSKHGDVLIPSSGETASDIATCTCVLVDNVLIGGDINLFRGTSANGIFISYALNHKRNDEIARLAQGASVVHIYSKQLEKVLMPTPTLPEQTKIANFLVLCDKKIEKQSEKVAALEEYKKGLMQKIFSREIRFKDDVGKDYPEWLWVPLSKVAMKIIDRNSDSQITNVITNSAVKGLIKQRDYFDKNIANDENINNYSIINYGDFVYNPRRSKEAPYGPIKMYKSNEPGIVSPIYLCFRLLTEKDINMNFLAFYFYSNSWYAYIHYFADRGARHDRVSMQDSRFFQMKIPKPAPKEQTKIANFLTLFDRKIEKEKEKLSALQEQKKGLLQQMFV